MPPKQSPLSPEPPPSELPPQPPPPPPLQQHVHFVFKLEAMLRKQGPWVPPAAPVPPLPPHPNTPASSANTTTRTAAGARGSTPKSRPGSGAVPERPAAPAPPAITDVDPNSLLLKLQFRPWVEYDVHQEAHFPSPALEQQKKAGVRGSMPEHDIVLPPAPLTYTPEAAAAAERQREKEAQALAAAEEAAAGQQEPGPNNGTSRKATPKGSSGRAMSPLLSPSASGLLAWDGQGEEPSRRWYLEHHFMMNVDEKFVRAMARDQANLLLPMELTQLGTRGSPEAPAKPAKGLSPVPESPLAGVRTVLSLGCGGLLVGETEAKEVWPSKLRPMPPELAALCESITVSLQALTAPVKPAEDASPIKAVAGKGKPAPAKGGNKEAPAPEPELSTMPGDPIKILTPELALRLNPLVVVPLRANCIPDAPATAAQLDEKCEPVKLRMCWPAKHTPYEQQGRPSPWHQVQPVSRQGPAIHQRCIGFGQAHVLLAGDYTADEVLQWCQERPLTLEVHDRTAIPEPPEFPVAPAAPAAAAEPPPEPKPETKAGSKAGTRREQEAAAAAAAAAAATAEAEAAAKAAAEAKENDGYVCAIARIPLLEIMRGSTMLRFAAPLAPYTTIRGAASLDWSKRPGNYAFAGSVLKGWVRTAVPISQMKGVMPLCERLFSRVAFVMDYRDSELFHLLEDTMRRQNAVALGLVDLPPPKSSAPPPPMPHPQAVLQGAMANFSGTKFSQAALEEALLSVECDAKGVDTSNPFLQEPWNTAAAGEPPSGKLNLPHVRPRTGSSRRVSGGHQQDSSRPGSVKARNTSDTGNWEGQLQQGAGGHKRRPSMSDGLLGGVNANPRRSVNSGAAGMHNSDAWGGTGQRGGHMTAKTPRAKGKAAQQLKDKEPKDRKALRFRGFAGVDDGSAGSDGSVEDMEPLTPAALRLNAALERLERIPLEMRLLQALSSTKLPPSELPKPAPAPSSKPPTPKNRPVKPAGKQPLTPSPPPPPTPPPPPQDLLTGFHLVDGVRRIIMLEGLCDGAMRIIRVIMDWCLEMLQPEPSWLKRVVLHNSKMRYPTRLWAELGADLHILKLGAPLHKIISEASSYATGKVRVECIIGLRKLGALASLKPGYCWARLIEDLQLYPSPNMVHLVDKKFGGELSKADVFGVEVNEFESDEDDGGLMGLMAEGDNSTASSKLSHAKSRKGRSSKNRARSRSNVFGGYERMHPPLLPLDTQNEAYVALREEARKRRANLNFQELHRQYLEEKAEATAHLRAEWATWNPYRQATHELCQAVDQGILTLEDTYRSWYLYHTLSSKGKLGAANKMGTAAQDGYEDPEEEAARNGWAAHPEPFRWPVPKSPREYVAHPHAPSHFRREQLAEPWEEGAMLAAVASPARTGPPPGQKDFVTTVNIRDRTGIQDGLFGKDPAFWQTVHESGTVQKQREREVREQEEMNWTKKLVVDDPVMRSTFPHRNKPTQEDRFSHILHDEPMKKSLQRSYVPPPPLSMYAEMPWSGETTTKLPKIDSSTFLAPGKDFKSALSVPKRDVSKLGPGQYQSWTASIHDKVYSQY